MQITQESVADIGKRITNLWGKCVNGIESARDRAAERASVITENWQKLVLAIQNTNTLPADLKRAVLLQQSVRDFALRLIPVRAFSTVFNAVPVEGTDKVVVPFYDLETGASTDFDEDEGYQMGDTTTSSRSVTIDKRKYQSMAWSSKELRRQPGLNLLNVARLKADKLGVDVFTDLCSLIKAANFPNVGFTGAASTFVSDSLAGLKLAAKTWPEVGRNLVLDSAYDANLLTDDSIKNSLVSGSTGAVTQGRVPAQVYGFNYFENPNIPDNGENLTGWINFVSAILFAQAPIGPSEEVLSQLTRYEVVTDPETGVSFEYRLWGNADLDGSREVIECNYGYDLGNAKALQRIRSAA